MRLLFYSGAGKDQDPDRYHLQIPLVIQYSDKAAVVSNSPTLIAIMDVDRVAKAAPRIALPTSFLVQLQIHYQAILLFTAGMKFVPNTTCPMGRTTPKFIEKTLLSTAVALFLVGYFAGWLAVFLVVAAMVAGVAMVVKPLSSSSNNTQVYCT